MRKYETVFISDPDLKDQARTELFDKVRNIIAGQKGILLDFAEWGNKKLAYEIKKKFRGHYVCATYGGTGDLVKELERNFRLTDDVLKFMTIVLSEDMAAEVFEKEVQDEKDAQAAKDAETAAKEAAAKVAKEEAAKEKEAAEISETAAAPVETEEKTKSTES
ncbi:MAG: 30S ribosomal protein S6 [Desulfobacula sp.]|nr:30S ribosomal protein S6 [Desulfobacula sp.]